MDTNTHYISEENTFMIDCKDVILREFIVADLDKFHSLTWQPEIHEYLPVSFRTASTFPYEAYHKIFRKVLSIPTKSALLYHFLLLYITNIGLNSWNATIARFVGHLSADIHPNALACQLIQGETAALPDRWLRPSVSELIHYLDSCCDILRSESQPESGGMGD